MLLGQQTAMLISLNKAQQRAARVRSPSSVVYVLLHIDHTVVYAYFCNGYPMQPVTNISRALNQCRYKKIVTRSHQNCTSNDISAVVKCKNLPPDSIIIKTLPIFKYLIKNMSCSHKFPYLQPIAMIPWIGARILINMKREYAKIWSESFPVKWLIFAH